MTADRAAPETLAAAARALYAEGRTPAEVFAAIYDAPLPDEAALVLRDFVSEDHPLPVSWRTQPWALLLPPEYGPAPLPPDERAELAQLYRHDPGLILLGSSDDRTPTRLAYHVAELRAGRTTVLAATGAAFAPRDPSLLAALRAELTAAHQLALRAAQAGAYSAMTELYDLRDRLAHLATLEAELSRRPDRRT
jgi:hypothetical protein